MSDYKHLSLFQEKKLKFLRKIKKLTKKSIKVWAIVSVISVVFICGLIAFYINLERGSSDCSVSLNGNADSFNCSVNKENDRTSEENEIPEKDVPKSVESKSKSQGDVKPPKPKVKPDTPKPTENVPKLKDFSKWNKSCAYEMIVINKDNPIDSSRSFKTKLCHGKEMEINACEKLNDLIDAAKADGIDIWISSGYRSIELQTKLFNKQVEREKSKAVISQQEAEARAATVVARPKTSEHNTGLAVDFNGVRDDFYKTKEYKWLINHAHEYGFIERYKKECKDLTGVIYEPWHFRYVGVENAKKIKNSGLCLEKYVERI